MPVSEVIEFDAWGRMMYNTEYHPNTGKPFTESDLEYLCKFWEVDNWRTMSFALGKTEKALATKISKLRKEGLYGYYKNLNKHW